MNARQETRFSMYLAAHAVLDRHTAAWQGLKAFADGAAEFKRQVATVNDLARAQGAAGGSAEQKRVARQALAEAASKLGKAVLAYARKIGDTSLAWQGDQSPSDLLTRRDTDCARAAAQIVEAARTHLSALADYGVNEARVNAVAEKLTAYEALIPKPRSQKAVSRNATKAMDAAFAAADKMLGDVLDNLTPSLEDTAPDFVREYETAHRLAGADRPAEKQPASTAATAGKT